MTAYDPQNVFAKILRGELPCEKLYEDDHTFAFMDIMPRGDGHCLVIPKSPARTIIDIGADSLGHLARSVQIVARAAKSGMQADGLTILQFNESAGGQVVFHIHVHIIPRWTGVELKPHTGDMAPKETLVAHAAKIRAALSA
ncbi:HIT family protein [Terrarubrum flagellatum]|uniref:HIT family protein n=1 Tax=Terrirubrum flagellatum TaxID=2895980 RepID=UPI0031451557